MSDITFKCEWCEGKLTVDEKGRGTKVKCPLCGGEIQIPDLPNPDSVTVPQKFKNCPFCAEQILTDAIKCKHCGEFLTESRKLKTPPISQDIVLCPSCNAYQGKSRT